jgi:hypothetical protein
MGRAGRIVMVLLMLVGCGVPGERPIGFINQTRHPDADLWAIWRAAQLNLAKQIDLNPVQQTLQGAAANLVAGDARALAVQPRQVVVADQADVSSSLLAEATGAQRPDPTGLIACPEPCAVRYTPAYSVYEIPATRYAGSWEAQETNFSAILQYEFENHILHTLGYDTRWR